MALLRPWAMLLQTLPRRSFSQLTFEISSFSWGGEITPACGSPGIHCCACSHTQTGRDGSANGLLDTAVPPQQLAQKRSVGEIRSWCSTSTAGIPGDSVAGESFSADLSDVLFFHLTGKGKRKGRSRRGSKAWRFMCLSQGTLVFQSGMYSFLFSYCYEQ